MCHGKKTDFLGSKTRHNVICLLHCVNSSTKIMTFATLHEHLLNMNQRLPKPQQTDRGPTDRQRARTDRQTGRQTQKDHALTDRPTHSQSVKQTDKTDRTGKGSDGYSQVLFVFVDIVQSKYMGVFYQLHDGDFSLHLQMHKSNTTVKTAVKLIIGAREYLRSVAL